MQYSTERKEAVLRKMVPPHNRSIKQLAKEEGLLLPDSNNGPEDWSSQDKFAAVVETAALNEIELAEYCRRKGIYPEQIVLWRRACESANDWDREQNQRLKAEKKADRLQIRQLDNELRRKEKALAEAAVLLVLKKKPRRFGGTARKNDQPGRSP